MKSTYILAIFTGFFIASTSVTASEEESPVEDRITAIATEFETNYDRKQSRKEKKRGKDQSSIIVAERKAAIAALAAEITRKEKTSKDVKVHSPTPSVSK